MSKKAKLTVLYWLAMVVLGCTFVFSLWVVLSGTGQKYGGDRYFYGSLGAVVSVLFLVFLFYNRWTESTRRELSAPKPSSLSDMVRAVREACSRMKEVSSTAELKEKIPFVVDQSCAVRGEISERCRPQDVERVVARLLDLEQVLMLTIRMLNAGAGLTAAKAGVNQAYEHAIHASTAMSAFEERRATDV